MVFGFGCWLFDYCLLFRRFGFACLIVLIVDCVCGRLCYVDFLLVWVCDGVRFDDDLFVCIV